MKLKFIVLYCVGIVLLAFGNRHLWDDLQEERRAAEEKRKQYAEAEKRLNPTFEVQKLQYDSLNNKWSNPHLYFQRVNVSYVNFKALDKSKKSSIETNDDENASDSN